MKGIEQTELAKEIVKAISNQPNKRITFYDYMKMALYAPELGYYTKVRTKIGKKADFYTSSSVGPVFGKTIANNFAELLPYSTDRSEYSILEIGGGDGRFARDVLNELKHKYRNYYDKLKYYMLETSPYHRTLQHENVKEHLDSVIWINQLEDMPNPFEGIIFSNELVDAFPVHKVKKINGEIQEVYVTWNEDTSEFMETIDKVSDTRIIQYFNEQGIILKEGQTAEANLDAVDWVLSVSTVLGKGYIITIDYGYPAEEIYASHRHEGTIISYYHHTANDNPYQNIGDQDITSHVNFSALMKYGEESGLENVWFTTQSHYLLNNGILNYLKELEFSGLNQRDIFNDEAVKINRAIRQLITPGEMGETFKVLIQQKNIIEQKYRFLTEVWKQYGI